MKWRLTFAADVMPSEHFLPVLLGFNPVAAAKPPPRHKSQSATEPLRDIVAELGRLRCPEDAGRGVNINPVVGPEPIAGSTRASHARAYGVIPCGSPRSFGGIDRHERWFCDQNDP